MANLDVHIHFFGIPIHWLIVGIGYSVMSGGIVMLSLSSKISIAYHCLVAVGLILLFLGLFIAIFGKAYHWKKTGYIPNCGISDDYIEKQPILPQARASRKFPPLPPGRRGAYFTQKLPPIPELHPYKEDLSQSSASSGSLCEGRYGKNLKITATASIESDISNKS